MNQLRWRITWAVLSVVFFAFLTLANLAPESVRAASRSCPTRGCASASISRAASTGCSA